MIKNQSMRRRAAGIAFAVAGVVTAGMLAVGSVSAQGGSNVNPLSSPLGTPHAGNGHNAHGILRRELSVIAQALGIDEAALKAELGSGRSIAEIAAAKNVNVSVVIDAVVADRQTELAQAVADGKLTQAQADEKLEKFETQVTKVVNTAPPAGGPRNPRHPHNPEAAQPTAASGAQVGSPAATVAPPPQEEQNGGSPAATVAPPPQEEQNGGGRGGNGGGNGGGRGGNGGGNGGGRGGNGPRP